MCSISKGDKRFAKNRPQGVGGGGNERPGTDHVT